MSTRQSSRNQLNTNGLARYNEVWQLTFAPFTSSVITVASPTYRYNTFRNRYHRLPNGLRSLTENRYCTFSREWSHVMADENHRYTLVKNKTRPGDQWLLASADFELKKNHVECTLMVRSILKLTPGRLSLPCCLVNTTTTSMARSVIHWISGCTGKSVPAKWKKKGEKCAKLHFEHLCPVVFARLTQRLRNVNFCVYYA